MSKLKALIDLFQNKSESSKTTPSNAGQGAANALFTDLPDSINKANAKKGHLVPPKMNLLSVGIEQHRERPPSSRRSRRGSR